MYCLEFTIQPTAALTFRILPGSILNIATYPLYRLLLSGFHEARDDECGSRDSRNPN